MMAAQLRSLEEGATGLGQALKEGFGTLTAGDASVVQEDVNGKEELGLRNRAAESKSPYVRAHAGNPVAWQMWGDEAVGMARRENKLLFVSIGYSACHCRFPFFSSRFGPCVCVCGDLWEGEERGRWEDGKMGRFGDWNPMLML